MWGRRTQQPGPLHTKPKAHVEDEETPKDEQRESKLPRDVTEDDLVLGQSRSQEGRMACP